MSYLAFKSADTASKRARATRDELLRGQDRYGKQLSMWILIQILDFLDTRDLATSQRVCAGWRLSMSRMDMRWRQLYSRVWKRDAVPHLSKEQVDAKQAFQRRLQTETNWKQGRYRTKLHKFPTCFPTALFVTPQDNTLVLGCDDGSLIMGSIFDVWFSRVKAQEAIAARRRPIDGPIQQITALSVLEKDRRQWVLGYRNGLVLVIDANELKIQKTWKLAGFVYDLACHQTTLLAFHFPNTVTVLDSEQEGPIRQLDLILCILSRNNTIDWENSIIYAGSIEGSIVSIGFKEVVPKKTPFLDNSDGCRTLVYDQDSQKLFVNDYKSLFSIHVPTGKRQVVHEKMYTTLLAKRLDVLVTDDPHGTFLQPLEPLDSRRIWIRKPLRFLDPCQCTRDVWCVLDTDNVLTLYDFSARSFYAAGSF